jgi:RNA polymerase-binding transcription factor DksA
MLGANSRRCCAELEEEPAMRRDEIAQLLSDAERGVRREIAELGEFAGLGSSPRDASGEIDDVGQHPADAGSDTTEREVNLGLLDDAETVLAEIAAARQRLADGSYGRCQTCDQVIAEERLRALPWARRCTAHVAARERVHMVRSTPRARISEFGTQSDDALWDPEDDDAAPAAEEAAVHDVAEGR